MVQLGTALRWRKQSEMPWAAKAGVQPCVPITGLFLQAKPEVKAGELLQLQLIPGWML